jgi:arylformamidase
MIGPGMPVYPGTEGPVITDANTVERDGFAEKLLSMYSHTGTHMDAPAHMLADGLTLDRFDAGHYIGNACVIDVSGSPIIEPATLETHADTIRECAYLLMYTGWSQHWGHARYFEDFPVLSIEAARWIAGSGLKGVGLDAISVDPVGSTTFGNHFVLFRAGMVIIENLTRLLPLVNRTFLFSCLPLKLAEADGSPVRAVAILD